MGNQNGFHQAIINNINALRDSLLLLAETNIQNQNIEKNLDIAKLT